MARPFLFGTDETLLMWEHPIPFSPSPGEIRLRLRGEGEIILLRGFPITPFFNAPKHYVALL